MNVYPGSIVDVFTLKQYNQEDKVSGQRLYLIMDRGFFSTANVEELVSSGLSFIIPPCKHSEKGKEAISASIEASTILNI